MPEEADRVFEKVMLERDLRECENSDIKEYIRQRLAEVRDKEEVE